YASAPMPVQQYVPLAPPAQPASAQPNYPAYQTYPAQQPSRRLLSDLFRRPSNQEPPRLIPTPAGQPVCTGPGCTSATMLHPVPADAGFTQAQRVAAPESQQVAFVPVSRPADAPADGPASENSKISAAPPPAESLRFPK